MAEFSGRCHCGAVAFVFSAPAIRRAMRCNCSICKRRGALLSEFTLSAEELTISADRGALTTYQFGTGVAKHHFCRTCGITPFVETRLNPGRFRVNLGCIDDLDVFALPAHDYDGAAL